MLSKIESKPYRLFRAKTVSQGIAGITKNVCDVVLLNYYWGDTAVGEKVLGWAKINKPQIPIVVFTKKYQEFIDKKVIKSGAMDYLILDTINALSLDRSLRYAMDRKVDFSYLNYLTHHDYLTNLPNRVLFKQRLRHSIRLAKREEDDFALIFVDINNFKEINNVYGLDVGDKLLRYFSKRITEVVGDRGNVSRVGGDEFAIIFNKYSRVEQVQAIAQKVIDAIGHKVKIEKSSVVNVCSIGVALFPVSGEDENTLQRHANIATEFAKKKKLSSFQFYSKELELIDSEEDQLQKEFLNALSTNEIGIYFNPRFDCASDQITAIEVNPYWSHPEKGLLEYEQFVWHGLNNNIATRFAEWLLAASFENFKKLKVSEETKLVFNIDYKGLSSAGFPKIVEKYLNQYNFDGSKLEFDLIKVSQSEHNNIIEDCMHQLKALGVSFGLNNFGSDEQSLSYIKSLPVSLVKLSADFIDEIDTGEYSTLLAKALVDFAHSIGKEIVIEGIHEELPLNNIKALGFDYYKSLFSVDTLSLVDNTSVDLGIPNLQHSEKIFLSDTTNPND